MISARRKRRLRKTINEKEGCSRNVGRSGFVSSGIFIKGTGEMKNTQCRYGRTKMYLSSLRKAAAAVFQL